MNPVTEKIVRVTLESDPSITPVQRSTALAVLKGQVPCPLPSPPVAPREPMGPSNSPGDRDRPRYLRRPEAAQYLRCSIRQIDALKHNGDLPFHRLGRRLVVFRMEDVEALMNQHRIDATVAER